MKTKFSKAFMLILACSLFAFTTKPGGEGFEVYLDNNLAIQQHGSAMDNIKSLRLNENSKNSIITIKYHHCGKVGKNRVIALKDEKGKTLKEWKFPDVSAPVSPMKCAVKDIIDVKGSTVVTLYYSSTELPKGRTIAGVNLNSALVSSK